MTSKRGAVAANQSEVADVVDVVIGHGLDGALTRDDPFDDAPHTVFRQLVGELMKMGLSSRLPLEPLSSRGVLAKGKGGHHDRAGVVYVAEERVVLLRA